MTAVLTRELSQSKQTLGRLVLYDREMNKVFECKTLELPWKNNERQKSCIPSGLYNITLRTSPKYGRHFLVNNVKGRDAILIHAGNYYTDILGCILVGKDFRDINGDGLKDVTSSKTTLKQLLELAPNGFKLSIRNGI
ncbi:DUF5675 family protein [Flavobacterium beibuense]|uniref:DUF5675 family protein n=1 Tax=Flavobacterium beibuense TaxID=657326 RepID=UPI003A8DAF26